MVIRRIGRTKAVLLALCVLLPAILVADVAILAPPAAKFYASVLRARSVNAFEPKPHLRIRAGEVEAVATWYRRHPAKTLWFWLTRPSAELQYPQVRSVWLALNAILLLAAGAGLAGVLWHRWKDPVERLKRRTRDDGGRVSPLAAWWENRALEGVRRAKHPLNGVLLGVEKATGRPVVVTDEELNHHAFLPGTTGSGKTTTITNFAESAIQRGLPLVVVDGKGDPGLPGTVRTMAARHGRPFWLFAMRGDSCSYNPLAHGGITELTDKLITLTDWTEPHYEHLARRYLQAAFRVLKATGTAVDIPTLAGHLDPGALGSLARKMRDEAEQKAVFDVLDAYKIDELKGLVARIALLVKPLTSGLADQVHNGWRSKDGELVEDGVDGSGTSLPVGHGLQIRHDQPSQ